VPPLLEADLVGLVMVSLADLLSADLPKGAIRDADLIVRARYAVETMVYFDASSLRRAGWIPARLIMPPATACELAWERFNRWWDEDVMPAFGRVMTVASADLQTRDGQLFNQLRSIHDESPLTADADDLQAEAERALALADATDARNRKQVSPWPASKMLELLHQHAAWSPDVVWRARDGSLHLGERQLRDRLSKLLQLRRPQNESKAQPLIEEPLAPQDDPADQAADREERDLLERVWPILEAAARDDMDRKDLALLREGRLNRSDRARELKVREGTLRARERKLADRALRRAPPGIRAMLVARAG